MCEKNTIWFRVSSPYPAETCLPPSVRVSRLFAPNLYSRVGPSWVTIFSVLPFSTFEKVEALLGPPSAALSFVPICSFVSFVYLKRCIGIRIVFPCLGWSDLLTPPVLFQELLVDIVLLADELDQI